MNINVLMLLNNVMGIQINDEGKKLLNSNFKEYKQLYEIERDEK